MAQSPSRCLIGVQARSNSKRFPNKIYEKIGDVSLLERVWNAITDSRIKEACSSWNLTAAVLIPKEDELLKSFCKKKGFLCFEGHPTDLYRRYEEAMNAFHADRMIRITADCPFVPPTMVVDCLKALEQYDYASNTIVRTFPEGWDIQGCSQKAFRWLSDNQKKEREHPFFWLDENREVRKDFEEHGFSWTSIVFSNAPVLLKLSIDSPEDLIRLRKIWNKSQKAGSTEPNKS